MTLNGHFALKSVSDSAPNELASPAFRQNCSKTCRATHIQIFAGFRWRGGVKWEWCDFRFIRSLSSEHFTCMATRQLSSHTTVNDLWHISRSLDCFTSNFSVWYGKSYYRLLIGNHTPFYWCHFWWPWSTFESHFSLGCYFHVHFSNPWHSFASHGLPAIAELLVRPPVTVVREDL